MAVQLGDGAYLSVAAPLSVSCKQSPPKMSALLLLFSAVVNASRALPSVTHDVLHHITTTGPPISSTFRVGWMRTSFRRPGRNSTPWNGRAEFAGLAALGLPRFTWCVRKTAPRGHAVTSAASTLSPLQTPTLCPECWALWPGWLTARLTTARATTRCQFIRPTSPRQTSRLCLSCTSSCAYPSAATARYLYVVCIYGTICLQI
jgi:hypothetical protein